LYCFSFVIGIKHCVMDERDFRDGCFSYWTSCDSWIHNCFWLVDLKKSSPLKPLSQMNRNLVGRIHLSSK
jgi:hypothetical protein